jgi:hypothetical protein
MRLAMVHLPKFDAGLPLDAHSCAYLHVLDRVRDSNATRLRRVLELVVTARGPDVLPAVLFELAYDVAASHVCNSTQRNEAVKKNAYYYTKLTAI